MELLEKLIEKLETGGQTKYSLHFIKKIANKLLEDDKFCTCLNRQDQHNNGNTWICGECDKEIKQKNLL